MYLTFKITCYQLDHLLIEVITLFVMIKGASLSTSIFYAVVIIGKQNNNNRLCRLEMTTIPNNSLEVHLVSFTSKPQCSTIS